MRNKNLGKNIIYVGLFIGPQKVNVKCGTLLDYKTLNQDVRVHTHTNTNIYTHIAR